MRLRHDRRPDHPALVAGAAGVADRQAGAQGQGAQAHDDNPALVRPRTAQRRLGPPPLHVCLRESPKPSFLWTRTWLMCSCV